MSRCRFCGNEVIDGLGGHSSGCYETQLNDMRRLVQLVQDIPWYTRGRKVNDKLAEITGVAKVTEDRKKRLSDSEWNHQLLSDLFDYVYMTMKTARGQRETVPSDRYLDGEAILNVVKQAIRKAEMDSLDTWRKAAP